MRTNFKPSSFGFADALTTANVDLPLRLSRGDDRFVCSKGIFKA